MKSQLEIAIDLATKWHEGQRYGKLPYIKHLMDVDRWVVERNASVKSITEPYSKEAGDRIDCLRAIAFMHDLKEDTDCTDEEILMSGIMPRVLGAVWVLTKVEGQSYRDYIESVIQHPLAREVKICDTMANLTQSVKKGNTKRILKYTRQLAILVKGEYFD